MSEDKLLAEFKLLVNQCRANIAGDYPSKDDVTIVFASEYITGLRKLIAEKDLALDIANTRGLTRQQVATIAGLQIAEEKYCE